MKIPRIIQILNRVEAGFGEKGDLKGILKVQCQKLWLAGLLDFECDDDQPRADQQDAINLARDTVHRLTGRLLGLENEEQKFFIEISTALCRLWQFLEESRPPLRADVLEDLLARTRKILDEGEKLWRESTRETRQMAALDYAENIRWANLVFGNIFEPAPGAVALIPAEPAVKLN